MFKSCKLNVISFELFLIHETKALFECSQCYKHKIPHIETIYKINAFHWENPSKVCALVMDSMESPLRFNENNCWR